MTEIKCNVHRTYKAKRAPVPTKKNPHGCAACWQIYHQRLNERIELLEARITTVDRDLYEHKYAGLL